MKLVILMILLLCDYCFGKTSSFSLLKYIVSANKFHLKKVRSESELIGDDTVLDFIGLVECHGYPGEEHKVTTDDGYILTVHRIPYSPKSNKSNIKAPVVFLQHGLLMSSDSWVFQSPERTLPFLLADEGYDVWVGNYRGNTYCRSHVNMTTDDPNFWKFSYHDMGLYDIPQSIDYILNYTKSKKLFFIGHSMGTTSSYVMLSTKQSYNNKIRLVISLAPTAYFKEKFPPYLDTLSKFVPLVKTMFDEQGIYEVLPQSKLFKLIGLNFCNKNSIFLSICIEIIYRISGRDTEQLNESILPFIWTYIPAGSSFQAVYHYYQNYVTGNFEAYDYGYEDNLIHYKTPKPPTYKVNKIVAPVALIYGINDVLTREKSVKVLTKKLSNVVTCEAVPYKNFGHLDFIIANDVKSLVFDRILQLMKDF